MGLLNFGLVSVKAVWSKTGNAPFLVSVFIISLSSFPFLLGCGDMPIDF